MDDQVVFLVEGEAADKAPELSFLLVLRLDEGQEEQRSSAQRWQPCPPVARA